MKQDTRQRIVVTGGAGLVGQNLVIALLERGYTELRVIDKSAHNLAVLRELHPRLETIRADLAEPGTWQRALADADIVVLLHAQIGGLREDEFRRNNVAATENVLRALTGRPDSYLLHVSSSAVESAADDFYTRTKSAQEERVKAAPQPWFVLRPTLMFGWFDRKHLGWLSRFMRRVPVFPVPGTGGYLRQPLYAGDFCRVLLACIERRPSGECVSISGKEKVPYLEIVRKIRAVTGSRCPILHVPVRLFRFLLRVYGLFDRNPPFTVGQLDALTIDELFEDQDWESRFGLRATPLDRALRETFTDPRYSGIVLEF